ncbi:LPS translocon maturation chaperone LptM [Colwellia sp. TT2012]|uniref:LPS translocon maturation chaperone LptM n=1 Tax=Colwellia sp. TT2012 TaxID=1720342 RepID=UPI001E5DF45B|nr:lipoprotein [Colwellia sp. TT2012]
MSTNRPRYLHRNLNFKTILLTFIAAIFLSACGIKGDLYQAPEQGNEASNETGNVAEQADKSQEKSVTASDESKKKQSVQSPIKLLVIPSVKPSTDPVKE